MDTSIPHTIHLIKTALGLWLGLFAFIAFAGADPDWAVGIGFVVTLILTAMYGYLSLDRFLSDQQVLARLEAK